MPCKMCGAAERYGYRSYCRECCKAYQRGWRARNPDSRKASAGRWRAKNPMYLQQYEARDPERWRRYRNLLTRQYRLRLQAVAHESYTLLEIAQRDKFVCYLCGQRVKRAEASIDHVIPLSKGGTDLKGNVKLAHLRCNQRKSSSLLVEGRT